MRFISTNESSWIDFAKSLSKELRAPIDERVSKPLLDFTLPLPGDQRHVCQLKGRSARLRTGLAPGYRRDAVNLPLHYRQLLTRPPVEGTRGLPALG